MGSELKITRFWTFRMWLARKIIGKNTAFLYNANILSDGGVFLCPVQLNYMHGCIVGSASYILNARRITHQPREPTHGR